MRVRKRPRLALEMGALGCVDPFELELCEEPPGSGSFRLRARGGKLDSKALEVERAGLCVAGCSQALMDLSLRWYFEARVLAGKDVVPGEEGPPPLGEMRLVVRRREARLLAALLRRHVARLPQPPAWMRDLLRGIEEMDEFLRWQPDERE